MPPKQQNKPAHSFFTNRLLQWFANNDRPLPWKGVKDPYLIWLSEIILQQTRVEQGRAYFERFRDQYPTVIELASAPEDELMKMWEGLGYYSRARNLHTTAKRIVDEFDSIFPDDYDTIKSLKGVGPYTAAAIASFAFKLPYAVVDGNVYRVLSRFFGIETPIDSTEGKKEFASLAEQLLDKSKPDQYNQAIMDFGATLCTPKSPDCAHCPLLEGCVAKKEGLIPLLPIKAKKLKKRTRYFNYLVLKHKDNRWIRRREQKDIWQKLYEFPLIESTKIEDLSGLKKTSEWDYFCGEKAELQRRSRPFSQQLTHQKIIAVFWEVTIGSRDFLPESKIVEVKRENLRNFAFPKIIDLYLQDNSLYLELL
jgi:A/G-specific adenine glycosylase